MMIDPVIQPIRKQNGRTQAILSIRTSLVRGSLRPLGCFTAKHRPNSQETTTSPWLGPQAMLTGGNAAGCHFRVARGPS